jgi:hypothetical protein
MKMAPMFAAVEGGDWWLVIPLIIVVYFIFVFIFQMLWNSTMPQVFGLKPIRFWQAFRILLIAGILFGSGSWVRFHG